MSPDEGGATYSLWLVPDNPTFRELESLISENQKRVNEPAFVPHITLLSGIEPEPDLSDRFHLLCRLTSCFTLRCREQERGDDYFHCFFIPVIISEKLKQLRETTESIFPVSSTRTFQPHISLMYAESRSNIVGKYINLLTDFSIKKVNIGGVELWNTNGPVDHWKCIHREKL